MMNTGFRIGRVSSIDYETGMMQILYTDKGNAVTAMMPYANFNNEYCMPGIGEQVLVGHLANGSSRGVVLGTMWNRKNVPSESGEGLYRKEFSKKRGAAIEKFDAESGELLVKSPIILIHGVDHTNLEGPEVNIAANLKTSFESPEHIVTVRSLQIAGLEESDISMEISNDVKIIMELSSLEALILKIELDILDSLQLKIGTELRIRALENIGTEAGKDMDISAGHEINMAAGENLKLEDGKFATTLSSILERLEALDGVKESRK